MFRRNIEKKSTGHGTVELSRRSFFGRLAIGAALSIGVPGVVQAAKSANVKADKNTRLQARKTTARLPKQPANQSAKTVFRNGKAQANRLQTTRASVQAKHATRHAESQSHVANARVRDVYHGNKHTSHVSANRTHETRIIQPSQRGTIIEPLRESPFLSDHGRLTSHRSLAIQNPHTGDKLSLTYFEKGRYLNDAIDEISFLLRDYRTGDVHDIDTELLDQLHDLKQMLGLNRPFDVICGYRSPLTNARLHAEHSGVANNSFHMHGRAVDIRIERLDIRRIRSAAVAMHRGGVGYYPESNFIHLDSGTFRTWTL
ncbi:MAG: DUF882 domain-containing protein [Methylomonas sp.]|nr:DUF882 domain-containing protein [Methylomonas sp.]PPD21702.1 MAG: hypothetical protein CTY23_04875 [Methylomonas sp.]PPD25767.1 MAG: hypothetical protein CTY22_07490 [Methylomonas sp.]PPD37014.1 MAG: hypothetical protein CTY21_07490 [Methylomonas sp.]PPD40666.1 MAG: hypothetical protein CTY17_05660 [Methylomonas sp.]